MKCMFIVAITVNERSANKQTTGTEVPGILPTVRQLCALKIYPASFRMSPGTQVSVRTESILKPS